MKHLSLKNYYWAYIFIIMLLQSVNLSAKEPVCKKVIIRFVDFDIMTTTNISCSEFDNAFSSEIQNLTISNSREVGKLVGLLRKLKIDEETKNIDVRVEVKLFYINNVTEEICMDRFNVLRGKDIYKMDTSLFKFIEKQKTKNRLNGVRHY
jgi:hypothetical protein